MEPKILQKLRRFAYLSRDDMNDVEQLLHHRRHIGARTDAVALGKISRDTIIILGGWAARYGLVKDGRRQITSFLLPGDHSRLDNPEQAIAAINHLDVAFVRADDLAALERDRPQVGVALARARLAEEARLCALATSLGRLDAEDRIGRTLCDLWHRADAIGLIRDGSLHFPLTQPDLADYTGLTAVHVNRMMRRLRVDGLAELKGHSLVIHDYAELAARVEYRCTDTGDTARS
ncbi:Crp/Fnr family transcriptional regulator [Sphingomonas sp. 3P27F8]|uniref:Crp/Fnr family transcriptional regulator n=1 Tax=Sphingomonas sp. 3P27F8 TaxID=2502213 RepID=UPI0010F47688|nr:Crp/Fnr family transcriptional regulator [Sphingomonas sp. 3P27F8]